MSQVPFVEVVIAAPEVETMHKIVPRTGEKIAEEMENFAEGFREGIIPIGNLPITIEVRPI